ncbi:MAG: hypothetical protein EKK55_23120 [Rhodocyclaceae bacterium]|nr:MAG: hypothetical protein EKK55_23120 [Rhodocyclaceae bacterium]
MTLAALQAWIVAHPAECVALALVVLSLANAALKGKPTSLLGRIVDRLSALTRADAKGTLSWPLIGRSIFEAVTAKPEPTAPPAPIEPEVPTAKHRTQAMRAVDGRPGYLRLPRWFRRGLRATQHVAVSARAAWSIARALLVAAVLTGCPGWVRPECATPGRYECRANQPHYCGTSKQLTPIGDVPCGAGETCSLNAEGVAHCAPATDGGVQ